MSPTDDVELAADMELADSMEVTDDIEPSYDMGPTKDLELAGFMEPTDDMDPTDDAGSANSAGQSSSTGQSNNTGPSWRTFGELVDDMTNLHLDKLKLLPRSSWPTPEWIGVHLVRDMESRFMLENCGRGKDSKLRIPHKMLHAQIALFMARMFRIVRICCAGESADPDHDVLAIYVEDGPDKGTYVESRDQFHQLAWRFDRWLTAEDCDKIIKILRTSKDVPRVARCMDKDLVAVNNGIFDYKNKKLLAFSPDYVFMAKSQVDYNPNATNVIIHNDEDGTDWDVESWIKELADDPEIVNLIWEILGAIIRPFVRWNKSAWLYSEEGNNGKGTLCELMRQLCGEKAVASICLKDFAKDFALEQLKNATAIIADENGVGTFVDDAANFKAVITSDVIYVNRKNKPFMSCRFYGLVVECLNEFPRVKDKSNSFYRRQLFIPFDKCFTGKERKYIKEDYLHRKDVLEYVLYRVLNMNYYELSNPQRCQNVLEEYKGYNDPVRMFFQEMEFRFAWNLLPLKFVYDLYKAWFRDNNPRGSVQGKNTFLKELYSVTQSSQLWTYVKTDKPIRPGNKMDAPEPLIIQYNLENWMNPHYEGSNADLIAKTAVQPIYHGGLLRRDNPLKPLADPNCTERTGT